MEKSLGCLLSASSAASARNSISKGISRNSDGGGSSKRGDPVKRKSCSDLSSLLETCLCSVVSAVSCLALQIAAALTHEAGTIAVAAATRGLPAQAHAHEHSHACVCVSCSPADCGLCNEHPSAAITRQGFRSSRSQFTAHIPHSVLLLFLHAPFPFAGHG